MVQKSTVNLAGQQEVYGSLKLKHKSSANVLNDTEPRTLRIQGDMVSDFPLLGQNNIQQMFIQSVINSEASRNN